MKIQKQRPERNIAWRQLAAARAWIRVGIILVLATAAIFAPAMRLEGQTSSSLSQVKALYFETFDGGNDGAELRQSLIKRLQKSGKYRIVDSLKDADAVVTGHGEIWVRGYFATNVRTPAANRHPVYGGFLSVEVVGKDHEPLWSYLVTPSRFSWVSIQNDLVNNLVMEMLLASEDNRQPIAAPGVKQVLAPAKLAGAGATFPAPLYQKWFQSFQAQHPGVYLTYSAVGSEEGMRRLAESKVDFAASDVSSLNAATSEKGPALRRVATVLGAVVPIYNLSGVTQDLAFTPDMLADIYLGRIRKWNDPRIRSSNKGVDLPETEIAVIHRSDGSGTTYAWSDFLSKVSLDWKKTVGTGTTLPWPTGTGAAGNEGVASAVQATPNSIGYVELVYAVQHELSFGAVRNSSGIYVRADLNSVAAAAKTAMGPASPDSVFSITNTSGKDAYPIASLTWLFFPQEMTDAAKKQALIELLRWILTSGQQECSSLGYAPLPREIAAQQLGLLNSW